MESALVDYLIPIKTVGGSSVCKLGRKYLVADNPLRALSLLDSRGPEWRDHP